MRLQWMILVVGVGNVYSNSISPSDLTERFNQQRKENLLYENAPKLQNLTPPKENLEEEKEIQQLQENLKDRNKNEDNLPCFEIEDIKLTSTLENFEENFAFLNPILKSYTHQCLNQNNLASLLDELKITSIQRGYITTVFGLKPQNLNDGVLDIIAETSLVGKININNPALIAFWGKDFGIDVGDVLNVEPLERGLYNYKRLRTLTPRFFIQSLPAIDEVSQTQIDIVFEQKELFGTKLPFYLNATLDNGGGEVSGMYQTSFQAGIENALSLNEVLSGYAILTPQWKKDTHNLYSSLDFSIPFRRFLFSTSGSYSLYSYPLRFATGSIRYHGFSSNLDLKAKILAYMDNLNQLSVSFGLGKRWAKNFLENIELITQSRNLTNIYASLDYLRYFQNGASLNLSLGIKQGVKFLGSMQNFPSNEKNPPNFFYTLPTLDAYVLYPFGWGEHQLVYAGFIKTQVSRTQLYASEKMGLGGIYSVRGFDSTALSGDFGMLNRNDLSYYIPPFYGVSIAPSIGVDMGYVADIYTPASFSMGNKGFVSGGGIGIKLDYKQYFQAQIWGYMPFYNPNKQKERNFFFSISGGF